MLSYPRERMCSLSPKDGIISLDKKEYLAGEDIRISYFGITEEMIRSRATALIYRKGDPHDGKAHEPRHFAKESGVEIGRMHLNGEYEMRLYTSYIIRDDDTFVMSVPFTVSGAAEVVGSDWAVGTLERAAQLELIPDVLKGQDMSRPITRGEFAAICVKVFERLTDTKAVIASPNPFVDTSEAEILKAFNHNLMVGTSATEFTPHMLLNRETLAAALMKVMAASHKFMYGSFDETYTRPAPFADDFYDEVKQGVSEAERFGLISAVRAN